jgi:transposase
VIELVAGRRVFVHREPVDMRKAFDGLSGLVASALGEDVLRGDVFVFVGWDRRRAKAIVWDGTGLCLLAKRLAKGRFAAPWGRPGAGPLALSRSELMLFFEGSEVALRRASPAPFRREDAPLVFR